MINWLKNIFKTKRILEQDGKFYPQKGWISWYWVDRDDGYLWSSLVYGMKNSECSSLEEADKILKKDFKLTKKYHYV